MNFHEFEKLVNCGVKEMALTEDVILQDCEAQNYVWGIEICTDNLIIDGNNHSIDGNGTASLLNINASNIILKNIIFKNGCFECSGGAIRSTGHLVIENCDFIDNYSDYYGGAIYSTCGLHVKNSRFIKNRADYGGAIYIDIDSLSGLTLEGCVFDSNTSEFEGGAIYNRSKAQIHESSFVKNASFKGGAIYNNHLLNIKSSSFKNNIASDGNHIESEKNVNICKCDFD